MNSIDFVNPFMDKFIGKAIDMFSSAKEGEYVFNERDGIIDIPNSAQLLNDFRESVDDQIEVLRTESVVGQAFNEDLNEQVELLKTL